MRTVFIFVSFEEKGCYRRYRNVSLGHQNFDCRSYCGLSRRMQGSTEVQRGPHKATEGQYSPVRLEQARLVGSLLYGTQTMLI